MGRFYMNCIRFDGIRKAVRPWNLTNCAVFAEKGTCKLHTDPVMDTVEKSFVDHCVNLIDILIESYNQKKRSGLVSWSRDGETNPGRSSQSAFFNGYRRMAAFADWLATEILDEVPSRQHVFTVPKLFRQYFRFNRILLG